MGTASRRQGVIETSLNPLVGSRNAPRPKKTDSRGVALMTSGGVNSRVCHAKALNDLARTGLEPCDPDVRQRYDDFKLDVTKQALKILKERIPAKILYFNEQVVRWCEIYAVIVPTHMEQNVSKYEDVHHQDLEPCSENPDTRGAKRPRMDPSLSSSAHAGTSSTESDAAFDDATNKETALHVSDQTLSHQNIPLNTQIVKMGERVRRDALELIEMVGVVRLWIQLNVPRIEDGNNFGVAIQEEAIQELGRVEDAAFNLCDGIKYHMTRAKLVSKVLKYPTVTDYVQSVVEVDRKEWIHLKVSLVDMRNSYSMLYDLLHKNWEKVVKPRAMEGNSLMVM